MSAYFAKFKTTYKYDAQVGITVVHTYPSKHDRRVLLVEDFADTRFMMRQLLEMSGYTVIEAKDGREAVEFAEQECPDLILMDLNLPEVDGISATRTIRNLEQLCDVPIIALTAHDTEDFYDVARAAKVRFECAF